MKYLKFIIFYLYLQYAGLSAIFQFLFTNNRGATAYSHKMINYFNLNFKLKDGSNKISKEKCLFLVNHCSWADFFIDTYVTHHATYLARSIVILGILFPGIYGYISGNIEYFKRSENMFKKVENSILKNINQSINKQFIIYPEGTRNKTNQLKKLKSGSMRIAYKNDIPCQILIISNKEKKLDEKKLEIQKNLTSEIMISKLIYPKDFENEEDFIKYINQEWINTWNKCFDKSINSSPYKLDAKMLSKSEIKFNNNKIYYSYAFLSFLFILFIKINFF